jgi:nickel transport protein
MNTRRTLLIAFGLALLLPGLALGHGIGVQATLEQGTVHLEGYFDDDTPAADARVRIETEDGQLIVEGKTDDKGLWSFPAPAPGQYRVILDAGAGHVARIRLTIPESPATSATNVSEGPTRAEFTQFPWGRLVVGLGVIGLLAVGTRWLRGKRG